MKGEADVDEGDEDDDGVTVKMMMEEETSERLGKARLLLNEQGSHFNACKSVETIWQ